MLVSASIRVAHAGVIETEFHYPSAAFETRWRGDTIQVGLTGGAREWIPGLPDLPVKAEPIELPAGVRVRSLSWRILRTERLADRARIPIVGPGPGRTDGSPVLRRTGDPAPVLELGYQGRMRGRNLAWILVRPVRWNPSESGVERISALHLKIETEPESQADALMRERIVPEWEEGASPAQAQSLPRRGAQPFKPTQLPSVLGSPVAYVIVTSDALAPEFQRLADWKTQAGVPAVVRTLSFVRSQYSGSDDAERIRLFLRDAYARWGTKWALLGGDTDVIPTRIAWTRFFASAGDLSDIPTDLYFSCLDGNWNADGDSLYGEGDSTSTIVRDQADLLPEIWVGRAPVSSLAEAARFVDRTLQYARTPVGDYERNILFFAEVLDPQDWSPGEFVYLDGAALVEECLPSLRPNPNLHYARLYENHLDPAWEPGALQETKRRVVDSLNVGYNLAVHSGHGFRNVMSLGDSNFTNADAALLANGNRLTNFYTVNCTSNAIDFPCLGEALMKAPNGGAVTNIGSTRLDFPNTGRAYQREFFRLLFRDSVNAVGEAQGRQKLPFVPNSNLDLTHRWTQMTLLLLGDPELRIWTGRPRTLAVSHPPAMEADDTTFTVHVDGGGAPLYKARVTAYKANDDYRSVLTDGAGNATLDFRPDGAGSFTLTVTGYDCKPYQASIPVTASPGPLLVEDAPTLDDDELGGTQGNGDGILDAGEIVDLRVPVRNAGSASAGSVVGVLSTSDPMVTFVDADASYGTIGAGATVTGAYRFTTAYTAPDQREIPFSLSIVDGAGRHFVEPIRLTLRAPEPRHVSHVVAEPSGDGDGRPEPGETVSYTLTLRNFGTGVARGVTVTARSHDGLAGVTDSTSSLGDIAAGGSKTGDAITFSVVGAAAKLQLRISTFQGLLATESLDLVWPATPANLSGRGLVGEVRLAWNANGEPDLAGYHLHRASSQAGPYVKVTSVATERTAYYLDDDLAPLTRYFYRVSAIDSSGNESSLSAPVSISTTPPSHSVFPIAMEGNTPSSVTVVRIYRPGKMDVIAGAEHLYVWHEDGTAPVDADGTPITVGDFTSRGSYYAAGASVADLDGGPLEIIAPTWNDQALYVFDQAGQVKPGWPFVAAYPIWSLAAIGDLDKNGTKEVVFASNGNHLYVLRANGTEWIDGDANPATPGVFKVLGAAYNYGTPALADLDGNGQLDIVFASNDGNLYAWRPDGSSLPSFPIALGGGVTGSVAIGYLDGPADTQPEIVVAGGTGDDSLYVFLANGGRRAGFPVPLVTGGGYGKQPSPALADMNGDAFTDIVAAGTDGRLFVWDRFGALFPGFSNLRFSALTSAATESSPVVADIDGDGSSDVVIGDDNATLSAFDASGAALQGFPIALGAEVKSTPALCDCDGDGLTEIVVASWDGQLHLWDYDFPFSPSGLPPWPQFHHDAMHTGLASPETIVAIPPGAQPQVLRLLSPAPNPARVRSAIGYELPESLEGVPFQLEIFDLSGRKIRRLAEGSVEPGRYSLPWDLQNARGRRVQPGLYFVVLRAGNERRSSRVAVIP